MLLLLMTWKQPPEVVEESGPAGPTRHLPLLRWLPCKSSVIVRLPRGAAVSAAGADGVSAAYSLAPALPALMVCLTVELSPG